MFSFQSEILICMYFKYLYSRTILVFQMYSITSAICLHLIPLTHSMLASVMIKYSALFVFITLYQTLSITFVFYCSVCAHCIYFIVKSFSCASGYVFLFTLLCYSSQSAIGLHFFKILHIHLLFLLNKLFTHSVLGKI